MRKFLDQQRIVSSPDTCGGKPRIAGTRIRVQDVYIWHELQRRSADEIVASFPHLTLADVHAALAYYFDHPTEIRQQIADDEMMVAALKAKLGPGPLEAKLLELSRAAATP